MLLFLLACAPSDPVVDGPGKGTAPTTAGPSTAPLLDDALDCSVPEVSEGPGAADHVFHRLSLTDVLCNDGSPAVAYVRAATEPASSGSWVVQLDGGAYCASGEDCAARWCGDGAYDARDMSSAWSTPTLALAGLASGSEANRFATWNQVYVPYCSSDMWMGQRRDVVLEADGVWYRAHFEGARIVDAVLDALLEGAASDDGAQLLPAVGAADRVLFGGASAGGMGAMVHLDAVAERLAPVPVTGVVDALWSPLPAAVAAAGADDPDHDPSYAEAMEAFRVGLWEDAVLELYDGRVEASCATDEDVPHHCIEPGVLQREHVRTPFAMHHDLSDRALAPLHLDQGASYAAYVAGSIVELEALVVARPDVSVLVSDCGRHTVLGSARYFHAMRMPVGDASSTTMHDGLSSRVDGEVVVTQVGVPSACP